MRVITCHSCEKSFRVRPEFAGRSTRCPSCGASLQINKGTSTTEAPPEAPRTKSAPVSSGMNYDTRPDRSKEWKKLAGAMSREQAAVLFLAGTLLMGLLFAACNLANFFRGGDQTLQIIFMLAIAIPGLIALAFGGIARLLATNVPSGYWAKPMAWLGVLGIGGALMSGLFAILAQSLNNRPVEEMSEVFFGIMAFFCCAISGGTLLVLIAQMGAAVGSITISKALGQFGLTIGVTIFIFFGFIVFLMVVIFLLDGGPRNNFYSSNSRRNPLDFIAQITLLVPLPLLLAISLVSYYRLLGVCRKTLLARAKGVYDER